MFAGARRQNGLSWRFLLLLGAFAGLGAVLYAGIPHPAVLVLAFVVVGWVISLCIHESAHAFAAYLGGDTSVRARGYLTLDPMAYANPGLTFGLPILYLLIGGIGLPGGAVDIQRRALRSRWWDSIAAAAGPAANLLVLILLALPFLLDMPARGGGEAFWSGLGFLAYLQATAVVLNLLPIPGFDGFGVLRPHLPYDMQAQADRIAAGTGLLLLILFFFPPFQIAVRNASVTVTDRAGIERYYVGTGFALFRLRI